MHRQGSGGVHCSLHLRQTAGDHLKACVSLLSAIMRLQGPSSKLARRLRNRTNLSSSDRKSVRCALHVKKLRDLGSALANLQVMYSCTLFKPTYRRSLPLLQSMVCRSAHYFQLDSAAAEMGKLEGLFTQELLSCLNPTNILIMAKLIKK